jgi:lipopolysaccharide/colanic/teichoic acid biosynthesis glycosyltransferase
MNPERPYRGKRAFDLIVLVVLSLPAGTLGLVAALAVKLDDRGPVLFRQERVGRGGRAFHVLKLRTMAHGAANPLFPDGSRITRSGRVLRRLSLDELPQLLNVLRGDMSIVGPRPTLAYQVARYTPEQRRRLAVRPGLTGLAQVKGRNNLPWADRILLDLEYIRKQSPLYDLYVLLLSVKVVLGGDVEGHPADDPIARLD